MLTRAFNGSPRYFGLLALFVAMIITGVGAYHVQLREGLFVTGMSRDVPWGAYISQFVFLVGAAASAVTVILPCCLHDCKAFSKITIIGEMLAVSACVMCMLFILADMGRPERVLNLMRYPSPNSLMFWDMVSLLGYLAINLVVGYMTLDAERKGAPPKKWVRVLIFISIPWAVSIHTVTAFLLSGLCGRPQFFTAITAPRFLASAFAAGPSLLILICLALKRATGFFPGKEAIDKLFVIVTYAMVLNVFFILLELFTALYGGVPDHVRHVTYQYLGSGDATLLSPFMIASSVLGLVSLLLLLAPSFRNHPSMRLVALIFVIVSLWLDKGLCLVISGFVPSPLGYYNEYRPTRIEMLVCLGIFAVGALVLTLLIKILLFVRSENEV